MCCRQPWPFCSPLDLCSFLIRFLIPLWAHCSAYQKPDTSQADERNHRGEQSLHLGGSELAASRRVGDIAGYSNRQGQDLGNRKGSPGRNGQPRETRPCYFLTWSPPALPSFLRPQGDLAIFDQGFQCAAPRASCDFGTGVWRGQLSMSTVSLQPGGGGARPAGDRQPPKHLPHDVAISMVSKAHWASASFSHQRKVWLLLGSQCGLAPSLSCGALKPASERRLQPPQEGACVLLKMVSEKPDSPKVCPKTERQPGNNLTF